MLPYCVFCSKAIHVCTDPTKGEALSDLKKQFSGVLKTLDGSSFPVLTHDELMNCWCFNAFLFLLPSLNTFRKLVFP